MPTSRGRRKKWQLPCHHTPGPWTREFRERASPSRITCLKSRNGMSSARLLTVRSTSLGNTEPLCRRAAGLRTLDHLQKRAEGNLPDLIQEAMKPQERNSPLRRPRWQADDRVNEPFPPTYSQEVVLIELKAVCDLVSAKAEQACLQGGLLRPCCFSLMHLLKV